MDYTNEEFDFENRIVDTQETPEDVFDGDNPLRPKSFDDYVGQDKVKENLRVYIKAAKLRNEALDHVLLSAAFMQMSRCCLAEF